MQTYLDINHAIAVNNGTNALYLALTALGIKPGDEVIVPANTFVATAWAPSYLGAIPVFVDCDENTWNICPHKLEKAITPKTKLIELHWAALYKSDAGVLICRAMEKK